MRKCDRVRFFLSDHGGDQRERLRSEVDSVGLVGGPRTMSCNAM